MKRAFTLSLMTLITMVVMIGADFKKPKDVQVQARKHCTGYSIVEAGLGVDCYGDTVKLIKKHGYYELASRYNVSSETVVN